jgi:Spy/CpxP family protein refolding chaperone
MSCAGMTFASAFAVLSFATAASAQEARAGQIAPRQGGARAAGRANGQAPLARELRQKFNGVIQRQLNLSAEGTRHLEQVDRKFEQQRVALRRDEREARQGLRAALADTANVDQAKISQYMDQLTRGQRRRADIVEAEQKELSTFLTPMQRAKLQGLREQLTQRVRQLQQPGAGGRKGLQPLPDDR